MTWEMVRTYRDIKRNPYVVVLLLFITVVLILVGLYIGVAVLVAVFWQGASPWFLPFALPWLVGTGWGTYEIFFHQCYEIRLSDEGLYEFRSLIGRTRVPAYRVTAVELPVEDGDCARVRYQHGTINVGLQGGDFQDFIVHLIELNPDVKVREC